MSVFEAVAAWFATLATYKKVLLGLATTVFLVELGLRRFARRSRFYARWTRGFEAVGDVWSAVLLSIIYALSVGPVSLLMRLRGQDPLDRARRGPTAWHAHEPNPLGPAAAARHQF